MKNTLRLEFFIKSLLALIVFTQASVYAQPAIQWDKTIGGSSPDYLSDMQQTTDGGYILGGTSLSPIGGDKSQGSMGGKDYWIVKLSATKTKIWDKTFGGSGVDGLASIQQTSDGGYILGGTSDSPASGNKLAANKGGTDYWIVKIDANGVKQWDKSYGGSENDNLEVVRQTPDGGYILGGTSNSDKGEDKSEDNYGDPYDGDLWIVKITANGSIEWDRTFGAIANESLTCLSFASDGGYLLGGWESYDGVYGDYEIKKLAADGTLLWQDQIGPDNDIAWLQEFQETPDGGYILGGYSGAEAGGDQTENTSGSFDYWVVKLNAARDVEWDEVIGVTSNPLGRTGADILVSLQQTQDSGFLLAGQTREGARGDKTEENIGKNDFWIVKIDALGHFVWDKTIGGTEDDLMEVMCKTSDGGFILGGTSASNAGYNKSEDSKGSLDYWIVKLAPENSPTKTAIRINAGGPEFTTATKKTFVADKYYTGIDRTSSVASGDIPNTTNDILYQSARCSPTFSYNIPVPNGEVSVYLHFAETYFGAPGKKGGAGSRQFHVNIEGVRKLTNYDIFTQAGGAMLATAEIFTVNVTDGMLNIDFLTGAADLPRVSAIEVIRTNYALKPVADSYVRDGSYNRTNYGDATTLEVKNSASDPSLRRSSYLKFQLPAATPVASAKLRIYGNIPEDNLYPCKVHAYGVNDDSWTENGILKVNAPAASTPSLGYVSVNRQYIYYEIDVTSYVKVQQQSGDLTVSLLLDDPINRNSLFVFNSKENAANPPQLVIVPGTVTNSNTREGVEEISSGAEAEPESSSVYPNPAGKQFTVAISSKHSQAISLDLLNNSGQSYKVETTQKAIAGQKAEVDISGLSLNSGIYMLKIKSKAATEVIKVLVTD